MTPSSPEKFALLLARGALLAFEVSMTVIAVALDPGREGIFEEGNRRLRGRVRTVAGTLEPADYDEHGQRVGMETRSLAIRDE